MVEDFKKVLDVLKERGKPVWIFAFLKMDEFLDKWSLVISAPWINESNKNSEFEGVLDIVKKNISNEKLSSIARIVLLDKDDHLIQELLKKNSGDEIRDEKINGNTVHYGYIIESNPNLELQVNGNLFRK